MNSEAHLCPFCDQDGLVPEIFSDTFDYNQSKITVDGLACYSCTRCGEKSIFPEQARANQPLILDAKRHADGLLAGEDIKRLREHFRISQEEAAVIFGGGRNAFSKYERSEVAQSVAMDRLLRLAAIKYDNFALLCEMVGAKARDKYEYLD